MTLSIEGSFYPIASLQASFKVFLNMRRIECLKTLGLEEGCSENEIRAAYKKLAMEYHPDRNPDRKEEFSAKFVEISNAYQYLMKKEKTPLEEFFPSFIPPDLLMSLLFARLFEQHHFDMFDYTDSDDEYFYSPEFFDFTDSDDEYSYPTERPPPILAFDAPKCTGTTHASISLKWSDPVKIGLLKIHSYTLLMSEFGKEGPFVVVYSGDKKQTTVGHLNADSTYYFKVVARDICGDDYTSKVIAFHTKKQKKPPPKKRKKSPLKKQKKRRGKNKA